MSDDLEKALGPRKGFEKRQAEAHEAKEKQLQHPELREGEVFVANQKREEVLPSYQSARFGDVAYDNNGQPIEDLLIFTHLPSHSPHI